MGYKFLNDDTVVVAIPAALSGPDKLRLAAAEGQHEHIRLQVAARSA